MDYINVAKCRINTKVTSSLLSHPVTWSNISKQFPQRFLTFSTQLIVKINDGISTLNLSLLALKFTCIIVACAFEFELLFFVLTNNENLLFWYVTSHTIQQLAFYHNCKLNNVINRLEHLWQNHIKSTHLFLLLYSK